MEVEDGVSTAIPEIQLCSHDMGFVTVTALEHRAKRFLRRKLGRVAAIGHGWNEGQLSANCALRPALSGVSNTAVVDRHCSGQNAAIQ